MAVTYYDLQKGMEFDFPAKTFVCKKKGVVDADTCFTCFKNKQYKKFATRPLCKQKNIPDLSGTVGIKMKVVSVDNKKKTAKLKKLNEKRKTTFEIKTNKLLDILNSR